MLNGKHIVLGVTGGIAAYKACDLVSRLKKQGAQVRVVGAHVRVSDATVRVASKAFMR